MKKYIILLLVFVFIALMASSCMAGLSPDGSYGADVTYQNNNRGDYNRGRHFRNHRDRYDRNNDRNRDRDRDRDRDQNTLIIR